MRPKLLNTLSISRWHKSSPIRFGCVIGMLCGILLTLLAYVFMHVSANLPPSLHQFAESLYYRISTPGAVLEQTLGWTYTFSSSQSLTRHLFIVSLTNAVLTGALGALLTWFGARRAQAALVATDHKRQEPAVVKVETSSVLFWTIVAFALGILFTLFAYMLTRVAPGGENIVTALLMLLQGILYAPIQIVSAILGLPMQLRDLPDAQLSVVLLISLVNGLTCAFLVGLGVPFINWLIRHP